MESYCWITCTEYPPTWRQCPCEQIKTLLVLLINIICIMKGAVVIFVVTKHYSYKKKVEGRTWLALKSSMWHLNRWNQRLIYHHQNRNCIVVDIAEGNSTSLIPLNNELCIIPDYCCKYSDSGEDHPNSKVHWANMGPVWGWQDPGWPHELCYLAIIHLSGCVQTGFSKLRIWYCSMHVSCYLSVLCFHVCRCNGKPTLII